MCGLPAQAGERSRGGAPSSHADIYNEAAGGGDLVFLVVLLIRQAVPDLCHFYQCGPRIVISDRACDL
jgi:hypothetical protein